LRFDYDATGDSPNEDLAPNRLECWLQDIRAAISTARNLSGQTDICLLGVRMGATLAALIASADDIAQLVLWNPCGGKHYVREMKALARASANETDDAIGFESAGFTLLHETADRLKTIDLLKLPFRKDSKILLLQRDDIDSDPALEQHLRRCGAEVTQLKVPGYADMMAEPQFTVVPDAAIHQIVSWLTARVSVASPVSRSDHSDVFSETFTAQDGIGLVENAYQFGATRHLFGIATRAQNATSHDNKPAFVLINSGSVHRVGPNRLYITLARKLAARGFLCFRFDLHGLGDSISQPGERENHPYPTSAVSDTEHALKFLREEFGCARFILAGLCSGAHTAFHSGLSLLQYNIAEIILINPLTYRYVEGMSLATTSHYMDVAYYKGSARKLSSWLKLLRGKVDIINLFKLGIAQLKVTARSGLEYLREKLLDRATTQLSADLRTLFANQRLLSLFVAANDPGYSLLAGEARYMTMKGMNTNCIRLQFIPRADHTFSQRAPRHDVIDRICAHLTAQYDADGVCAK
jgi:alpha-beta hydrolase superfamily lysophospholipase